MKSTLSAGKGNQDLASAKLSDGRSLATCLLSAYSVCLQCTGHRQLLLLNTLGQNPPIFSESILGFLQLLLGFWGFGNAGVDVLVAQMRGAAQTTED